MSEKSPSEVVREVIALMRTERWSEIPAWIEPEAVQKNWENRLGQARQQQADPHRLTVEQYREHQPEMPIEVAQWTVDQHNRSAGELRFLDVPGVETIEELERLTPVELMAWMLQAGDSRYQLQAEISRQKPELAELGIESPPDEREVVGEVIAGELAYVVFVTRYAMSGSREPALAVLRRTVEGWRLMPDSQLLHGSSSFVSIGADSSPTARPVLPVVQQIEWVKRRFDHQLTPEHFPAVVDRFRSVAMRLEPISWLPKAIRTAKPDGKWSIQEHVGHLLDLEELGEQRLADYIARVDRLRAADMSNRKTHDADYNQADGWELLDRFRNAREALANKFDALPIEVIAHVAEHPRLKRPMNVPEWVFFMCEHDDHHLQRIRELSITQTDHALLRDSSPI